VEVDVAELRVARVPEAVHDEWWNARERPRRHDDALVLDAEPDRQLTLEHVEEIGVQTVDVQVCAVAVRAEARPRRVQRLVVGKDLDPSVRRVADDFASTERNQDRLVHERSMQCVAVEISGSNVIRSS
jgi:hypothetical protein